MLTFAILYFAIGLALTTGLVGYGILRWGEKVDQVDLSSCGLLTIFWAPIVLWCAVECYSERPR